ncbi:MAG TPA: glycosyltransferase [Terriglobales bacterium]|nr:glycosyltransferase [Terriglobales bacterium]
MNQTTAEIVSLPSNPEKSPLPETNRIDSRLNSGLPLRVLHIVTHFGCGGTENVVLKLMSGSGENCLEHSICSTRGFDSDFAALHKVESRLHVAGDSNPGFQFPFLKFRKIMRSYRPHIVHTRNWGSLEAVFAARSAGVPIVIHSEHGYEMENMAGMPLRHRLFRRAAYAIIDRFLTVSNELKDYHSRQAWFPRDRIRVIYNGVDTCRFAPNAAARASFREQLGIDHDAVVIGSVGRLTPIKNHATLLRAVERLIQSGLNAHGLLVGSGPEMSKLEQQVERSPYLHRRAHIVGASAAIPEMLNTMDVFVLPSLKEGMSNTLLEAMATGLAVVAGRVGGNPEVLSADCGFLFMPSDLEDLTGCLERLANDPALRRDLGSGARKRALGSFDLSQMLQNYRDLYLDAACERGITSEPRKQPICAA